MATIKEKLSRIKLWILCQVFFSLAYLLKKSYRYRYFGVEHLTAVRQAKPAYCLASWHEHALAGVLGQAGAGLPYCFIISRSMDGTFVNHLSRKLGYQTVRGSSSKGGKEARSELEDYVDRGFAACFTVDGPRGPRQQSKPGIVSISGKKQIPILPMVAICEKPMIMHKSWDKTKLPPPFSKIVYQFGKPIDPPANLSEESFSKALALVNSSLKETEAIALANLPRWSEGAKFFAQPLG